MKHKTRVHPDLDTQALATGLGDLRYDALRDVLEALAHKLERDSAADSGRGRPRLAASLSAAAAAVDAAAGSIATAWHISAPHMPAAPEEDPD